MAKVLSISINDSQETIRQKIEAWKEEGQASLKKFDAKKFTGKVKSFGDGLSYQQNIRNEWP